MYYVGIDIGGTNVKAGIVDDNGKIIVKSSIPTGRDREFSVIVGDIAEQIKKLCADANMTLDDINGIGIGCPGAINSKDGIVNYVCNLDWVNVPLVAELQKHINKPAYVSNDANVAALGESMFGTGKNYSDVVFITLGTGVGGGVIIDNKLFEGVESKGTELGHMVIVIGGEECGCGRRGCLEAYASATALIRDTKRAMEKDKNSAMWQFVDGDINKVDGRTAFECSKTGDESAKKVVDAYITYLSEGIANFVNIFRPQAIILGGGVCAQGDYLIKPIEEFVTKNTYGGEGAPELHFLIASLGNDAGLVGAASLAMQNNK